MDEKIPEHTFLLLQHLSRIADAQEGLLALAKEARQERLEIGEKMKQHFKAGFMKAEDK